MRDPHQKQGPAEAVARLRTGRMSGSAWQRDSDRVHSTNGRNRPMGHAPTQIDFDAVNRAALAALPALARRWLPDGRRLGREWVTRNPRRDDRRPGSFKVNLATGRWADFATGDAGGDVISLAAYLSGLSQREAAQRLAQMLGVRHG